MIYAIRTATGDDVASLQQLSAGLFIDELPSDEYLNAAWPAGETAWLYYRSMVDSGLALLAEVKGAPVGFLVGSVRSTDTATALRAELNQMYVDAAHRRNGIGRALVGEFFSWARSVNVAEVTVLAYADNENAISFYEAMGLRHWQTKLNAKLSDLG